MDQAKGWNPLTGFVLAGGAWIVALAVDRWWMSALLIAFTALASVGSRRRCAAFVAAVALSVPVAASLFIVHAPHGDVQWWGPLTVDGSWTAASLALRFLALMVTALAAASSTTVSELARAFQNAGLNPRVGYLVAASLQLLPEARNMIHTVRDSQSLAGRGVTGVSVLPHLVLPVIIQLVARGADRGVALEKAGLQVPGLRTLYCPVADSRLQWWVRRVVPVVCVAGAVVAVVS